jgi:iron complex transport system substrate-binding protein
MTRAIVAVAFWLALAVAGPTGQARPQRIVSLVPAATEMLFEMGAGSQLVGVGNFDRHPAEARALPKMGGLIDPHVERILATRPDLAIVYDTQTDLKQQLDRAGIPMFRYAHKDLADIAVTMQAIGDRVGASAGARHAVTRMNERLAAVRSRVAARPRPRTLLVFGRDPGALRRINASAGYGFLHDLLELAGGTDVLADLRKQSADLSTEAILTRAPEVILELHYGDSLQPERLDAERRVWNALPAVPAVRNGRVYLLAGDEFVVPGPRIVVAAERFAQALHPEAFPK